MVYKHNNWDVYIMLEGDKCYGKENSQVRVFWTAGRGGGGESYNFR